MKKEKKTAQEVMFEIQEEGSRFFANILIESRQSIRRLRIAIWALVIFQVIFVPCVLIAISSLWKSII